MSSLLNKTRKLNKILQKGGTEPVVFDAICAILSEVLSCNVYIVSRRGKVLGHTFTKEFECSIMEKTVIDDGRFNENYNESLLDINETVANLKSDGICVFKGQ